MHIHIHIYICIFICPHYMNIWIYWDFWALFEQTYFSETESVMSHLNKSSLGSHGVTLLVVYSWLYSEKKSFEIGNGSCHSFPISNKSSELSYIGHTGWRRLIKSPKLQIILHKRATKYRALLRKMTYKDKGSYESSPPYINKSFVCLIKDRP